MGKGTPKQNGEQKTGATTGPVNREAVRDGEPRSVGRPRSEAVRGTVMAAAYAILLETRMGGFSIEAVAARAGVARTTVYRWWPTKGRLAIESFLEAFKPKLAYGRSDRAADDFKALVKSLARALAGPDGRVAASVLMHAQGEPETLELFRDQFSEPLRTETSKLLQAGIDRGEFRPDLDIARVIDAVVGAIYLRLLLGHPLKPEGALALADTVLAGCHANAST